MELKYFIGDGNRIWSSAKDISAVTCCDALKQELDVVAVVPPADDTTVDRAAVPGFMQYHIILCSC